MTNRHVGTIQFILALVCAFALGWWSEVIPRALIASLCYLCGFNMRAAIDRWTNGPHWRVL
jgi:hypothetical protein